MALMLCARTRSLFDVGLAAILRVVPMLSFLEQHGMPTLVLAYFRVHQEITSLAKEFYVVWRLLPQLQPLRRAPLLDQQRVQYHLQLRIQQPAPQLAQQLAQQYRHRLHL